MQGAVATEMAKIAEGATVVGPAIASAGANLATTTVLAGSDASYSRSDDCGRFRSLISVGR